MHTFKKFIPMMAIIILSFWAIRPFLSIGFFPMHDDTQVARVFEMHKSLSDGIFPVRWVADLGYGYGYPIFNFYAPLAYYVGALFMFLGFDALIATKIMMTIGIVISGVFMYILAKEFWGKIGGIISGLLYVYAPYHALNIYVRGAVAEFWAYAFIPLVFAGTYNTFINIQRYADIEINQKSKISVRQAQDKQNQKLEVKLKKLIWMWVCVSSISYAAIVISHNLTAMMVTPFIFIFAIALYIKLRTDTKVVRPYMVLLGLLIGILLSCFYWLPVLLEMKFTNVLSVIGGGSDYRDHFICFSQLWSSPWGFAGSGPGCVDGFSLMIGKIHILFGILSLPIFYLLLRQNRNKFYISLLFLGFLLFSVFLTLKESVIIWNSIPHMAFFQFPWRFLVLISFLISFFGGGIFGILEHYFQQKGAKITLFLLGSGVAAGLIIYMNMEVFIAQKITDTKVEDYITKANLNWKISKISDEYMPKGFFKPLRSIDVPKRRFESEDRNLKISETSERTQHIKANFVAEKKALIYVNLAYFPGWHVFIDNKQVGFRHSGQGLLIDVPEGKHSLDIRFTQTQVEKISNVISIAGIVVLLAGIISHRKKVDGKKNT